MADGSICLYPVIQALAGPGSFQLNLKTALEKRGVQVQFDPRKADVQAVLLIGASRHIGTLLDVIQRGIPIVQRLDGMNWLHRRLKTGVKHYLRSETANMMLALSRRYLASRMIYQSRFSQEWWQRVHGDLAKPSQVILNGTDLQTFTPQGPERPPQDHVRVQVVEGHLVGGTAIGLEYAVQFALALEKQCKQRVELVVAGDVSDEAREKVHLQFPHAWVDYSGPVPRRMIPGLHRAAHLFYSADLNPACPNAVIESLACGDPVVAFDTGALKELVSGDAGRVAPFGGDPWNLDPPDFDGLAKASLDILADPGHFRSAARGLAESTLGVEKMAEAYLSVLRA